MKGSATIKKTERVVVSMMPDNVRVNVHDLPKHESDVLCRTVIRSVTEAFKNPQFAAEYELWLAKRYGEKSTVST